MHTIGFLLATALQIYIYLLIARMIISWVPALVPQWRPTGGVASVFEVVYTVTDPPIKMLRRVIPPLDLGGVSLDLAFMAVFVLVYVLQTLVHNLFW
ncbi:hypothetical protein HMPREF1531_01931 [Propionibacterium sp. oral taxon 192 str. F0372]|uniref:YggT family protein n=1 Tax=Propionibacterium sp. oral taxon 192 TaxID=671222 RepID=UPI0003535D92|nr:YggT family protein [Propionibacterium sp. oral taxon 192]EPH02623.1 hypothetical protein HMPREF1531_01931 [Propionibacterium sp. oral taxon 192 str. F0372]